jgi:hypothetical protein
MGDVPQQNQGPGNALAAIVMGVVLTVCSLGLANTQPFKWGGTNDAAVATQEPAALKTDKVASNNGGSSDTAASSQASDSWSKTPATIKAPDAIVPVSTVPESTTLSSFKGEQQASYSKPIAGDKIPATSGAVASSTAGAGGAAASGPSSAADSPKQHLPVGPNQPTVVTIKNAGGTTATVQRVEFFFSKSFKTPTREPSSAGKAQGIPVNFSQSNYDAKADKFSVSLTAPQVAMVANQPIPLAVALVWPAYAGWTYPGKLVVYQAGQQPVTIENVELDILKESPK